MHTYLVFIEVGSSAPLVEGMMGCKLKAIGKVKANNSHDACIKVKRGYKKQNLVFRSLRACLMLSTSSLEVY